MKIFASLSFLIIFGLLITGCDFRVSAPATPTSVAGDGPLNEWYVSPDAIGDYGGCHHPNHPCLTINFVLLLVAPGDTIFLAPGEYSERTFRGPVAETLLINKAVTIMGPESGEAFIDGEGNESIVEIKAGAHVNMQNLTFRNCPDYERSQTAIRVTEGSFLEMSNSKIETSCEVGLGVGIDSEVILGGVEVLGHSHTGVNNSGTLSILFSEIHDNHIRGISSVGNLLIEDSIIRANSIGVHVTGTNNLISRTQFFDNNDTDRGGVGLQLGAGSLTVEGSLFQNNFDAVRLVDLAAELDLHSSGFQENIGRAIVIDQGWARLTVVYMNGNGITYADSGTSGAIQNQDRLNITASLINQNRNGAIHNTATGEMFIVDTTIDDNSGILPAIWNEGTADIRNSAITFNLNDLGAGGVENYGDMVVVNSTVSGNTVGGVFAIEGTLNLQHVTIARNAGTGLAVSRAGTIDNIVVENTLIVQNNAGDCVLNLSEGGAFALTLNGVNMDSEDVIGTCGFSETYPDEDFALLDLANNGGFTYTHALGDGSVAIDAAPCIHVEDQRHEVRPQGAACDVGAYERGVGLVPLNLTGDDVGRVTTQTPCLQGPGQPYDTVNYLFEEMQVQIIAVGQQTGWLVLDSPLYPGVACWVDENTIDHGLDLGTLDVFGPPILPTPTPGPTNEPRPQDPPTPVPCYYNQQQQLICP